MKNTMEYKGYTGSVEYSDEDGIFFGKRKKGDADVKQPYHEISPLNFRHLILADETIDRRGCQPQETGHLRT